MVIGYSTVPKDKLGIEDLEPFWENKSFQTNWQEVFENRDVIPELSSSMLLLDGNHILNHKLSDLEDLAFENILLIYVPNMWVSHIEYEIAVRSVNNYYETSPYIGKNNQKDLKRGMYRSVSHGFTVHGGPKSLGNVVRYHQSKKTESEQVAIAGNGDIIASAIWKQLDMFGTSVKTFFQNQIHPLNDICIGVPGLKAQVHQLHVSKNSCIKPHIDKLDFGASFVAWFTNGKPKGGCFGIFQQCLKFDNNSGAGIFMFRKNINHGTLRFDAGSLSARDFKLGVALVNKEAVITRVRNQLRKGTKLTWEHRSDS